MNKSISVLIPVYNVSASYLWQSLESIVHQSLSPEDFDIIVGFDGTPCNELLECVSYFEERHSNFSVRYFPRSGLKSTLNRLVDITNTKYIVRFDSDDISHFDRLRTQLDFMESNPDIIVSGTATYCVGQGSISLKRYPTTSFFTLLLGALYGNPLAHPSVIIRSSALSSYPYSFQSPFEDYFLWAQLSAHGRLISIPSPLLFYRLHSSQVSSSRLSYIGHLICRLVFFRSLLIRYPFMIVIAPILLVILLVPHPRSILV